MLRTIDRKVVEAIEHLPDISHITFSNSKIKPAEIAALRIWGNQEDRYISKVFYVAGKFPGKIPRNLKKTKYRYTSNPKYKELRVVCSNSIDDDGKLDVWLADSYNTIFDIGEITKYKTIAKLNS